MTGPWCAGLHSELQTARRVRAAHKSGLCGAIEPGMQMRHAFPCSATTTTVRGRRRLRPTVPGRPEGQQWAVCRPMGLAQGQYRAVYCPLGPWRSPAAGAQKRRAPNSGTRQINGRLSARGSARRARQHRTGFWQVAKPGRCPFANGPDIARAIPDPVPHCALACAAPDYAITAARTPRC